MPCSCCPACTVNMAQLEADLRTLRETVKKLGVDLDNSDAIRGALVQTNAANAEMMRKAMARIENAEAVVNAAAYYLRRLEKAGKDKAITDPDSVPWTCEDAALRALAEALKKFEGSAPS